METLLVVAIVLTALAIIVQAGVLLSMYLLSRRLTSKAELLMTESQRLIAPLESITSNLKSVANDMAETGKVAHSQVLQIQRMLNETQANIRVHIAEVREMVLDTVDEARTVVMRPVREYSAIAMGIAEGIRTLFKGRRKESAETGVIIEEIVIEQKRPAA
ncbi:MAG TPA: hypothetical protein VGK48_08755 [Terriglobia bacterium]|jgi:hypothetical protein